jgi:hypothetical protein
MLWLEYNIENTPAGHWRVEKEAFDRGLYKEGDVFIVNKDGWLIKQEELTAMIMKYETKKNEV